MPPKDGRGALATGGLPMSDPLSWSIYLGCWAGVRVRIHFLLVVFAAVTLLDAALAKGHPVAQTAAWLVLLVLVLALHELGHAAMAIRLGLEPEDVRLWPLGNLVSPFTPATARSTETVAVAAAGLITSLVLAIVTAVGLNMIADAQMVFYPFGNAEGGGAPLLADGKTLARPFTPEWYFGWFGWLNWVVFLANLVPALPLDNGRIFRGMMDGPWTGPAKDGLVGPWTARVCAIFLGLAGLVRIVMVSNGGFILLMLAIIVYLFARLEARILEEGGFFDDTLFGYDFSQGYTSLEAGAATVRPRREGALRRWRRRRSEQRRRRQEARAAAEEQRMDEILEKLHREGRSSLTDEEHRFLVRVSAKFKNRTKSRE
jgi:stage IV sporulation protein FB